MSVYTSPLSLSAPMFLSVSKFFYPGTDLRQFIAQAGQAYLFIHSVILHFFIPAVCFVFFGVALERRWLEGVFEMGLNGNRCGLRIFLYVLGLICLAVGLTLNTKTGLGVAPVISVPFAVSTVCNLNFAVMVFMLYSLFAVAQFLLTLGKRNWNVFLQIPFSIVFTTLLNAFGSLFPITCTTLWQQLLLLAAAIVFTAIGVSLSVSMKLIPNPADGFAQVLGIVSGRGTGFGKNILDLSCVAVTYIIMIATGKCSNAVGIGTVVTMVGVGRVIALFYHFFRTNLDRVTLQKI